MSRSAANVTVNVIDMGAAASTGGVRYDLAGCSVIVIHNGLSFDMQSAMLAELTRPGERPVIDGETVPVQRRPSLAAHRLRVAAAVASLTAIAACAAPPAIP